LYSKRFVDAYKEDNYAITGFIDSHDELEFTIHKDQDDGIITLEDRVYRKEKLESFMKRNKNHWA